MEAEEARLVAQAKAAEEKAAAAEAEAEAARAEARRQHLRDLVSLATSRTRAQTLTPNPHSAP